jgi:hypothetical protein
VDGVSWGALALSLSVLGGIYTWWALHHRGIGAALRGAGLTLLPISLWMMGALSLVGNYVDVTSHFLTRLAFNPIVWAGLAMGILSVLLIGGGGVIAARQRPTAPKSSGASPPRKSLNRATPPQPAIDDDLAEIEALLKKRGIS